MEKTSITISIENERMEALTYYLQRKEQTTPQKILEKMLLEMYEKYVPQDTREYIDSRLKPVSAAKAKPKKTAPPKREMNTSGDNPGGRRTTVQGMDQTDLGTD